MAGIKISELSIGDWVMYRNREWQVCSLYQFTGEVGLWRKDSQICENVADLTPVPLTPEILEQNGWECIAVGDNGPATPKEHYNRYEKWRCESKWGYRDLFLDRMTKRWRLSGMNCTTFTEFHKLQHALRISGFEKEIEL